MPGETQLWLDEILEIEGGRAMKIKITKMLEQYDSPFQRIELYETKAFGRMLILDGVVMCTEADEHAYHEMIVHVPMFTHPNPESVLVIGGGDGGTLREVLKHPGVKRADICEIDGDVIRLSKKHLPGMACSYEDKRVSVYTEDGAKFIRERKNSYDVILVDSSDPIGPAEVLFREEFYAAIKDALKEDGIATNQCESMFYHGHIIERTMGFVKKLFAVPSYYYTMVPTYPSGVIGFAYCSKKYHPLKDFREERVEPMQSSMKYYNPGVHRGAFALPSFIKGRLAL